MLLKYPTPIDFFEPTDGGRELKSHDDRSGSEERADLRDMTARRELLDEADFDRLEQGKYDAKILLGKTPKKLKRFLEEK